MGLLGDVLPDFLPEDPQKREAARMGLLSFGAAMMAGAGRGGPWNTLGASTLAGLQGYQNTLEDQSRAGVRDLQKQALQMDVETQKQAVERQRRLTDAFKSFNGNGGAPGGLLVDSQPQPAGLLSAGSPAFPRQPMPNWMPQARVPAPAVPQVQVAPVSQQPATANNYQRYIAFAQHLEGQGLAKEAQEYYTLADKFRPKIKEQSTLLQNGKPVNVITYEDGRQEVSQFGALPNTQILNLGNRQVAVDKNLATDGQAWQIAQSPDSAASTASAAASRAQAERHFQAGRIPQGYRVAADGQTLEPIPGGPAALGKALPTAMVKDLEKQTGLANTTSRLSNSFKEDFGGKTWTGETGNYAGRIFGDQTGQSQWWQDYRLHEAQVRNELFGASLTAGEQSAWEKTSINPRMDAEQIKANLKRREEIEAAALERSMRSASVAGYNKSQIEELTGRQIPTGKKQGADKGKDVMSELPPASSSMGRTVLDNDTGKRYRSNGRQWVEVK